MAESDLIDREPVVLFFWRTDLVFPDNSFDSIAFFWNFPYAGKRTEGAEKNINPFDVL